MSLCDSSKLRGGVQGLVKKIFPPFSVVLLNVLFSSPSHLCFLLYVLYLYNLTYTDFLDLCRGLGVGRRKGPRQRRRVEGVGTVLRWRHSEWV